MRRFSIVSILRGVKVEEMVERWTVEIWGISSLGRAARAGALAGWHSFSCCEASGTMILFISTVFVIEAIYELHC